MNLAFKRSAKGPRLLPGTLVGCVTCVGADEERLMITFFFVEKFLKEHMKVVILNLS